LSLASKTRGLNADGTYKTNWNKYPFVVVGASDAKRVIHPLVSSLVSNETATDYE
jgi:hypothetical protein